MRECPYELYVAVHQAVREGIARGDSGIVRRVSMHLGGRHGVSCLIGTLALIEAKRGDPERSKQNVCEGLCGDLRCAA